MWGYFFFIGTCIGSFLNVLADRLPRDQSVVFDRSRCESCHHTLAWYDLIPLYSYLSLRGRCRYCSVSFSWQYPAVEVITGSMYALVWAFVSVSSLSELIIILTILSCLLVITLSDIRVHIIPDEMLVCLTIVTIISYLPTFSRVMLPSSTLSSGLLGAIVMGGIFFFLFLITKGKGMGFGDVKYALWMGLFLGVLPSMVAFYIAFLTGAIVSMILILGQSRTLKSTIAFGPFLIFGTVVAWGWSEWIWHWFLGVLV